MKLFGDESSKNYGEKAFRKSLKPSSKIHSYTKLFNFLLKCTFILELVFISLGRFVYSNTLKSPDQNALKPKTFCGKKHLVWSTETQPQLIKMIKHIKNKGNSRFICVCFTAIMAGITKYFKEVLNSSFK